MQKKWFVVHTLTGKENRVKASIEKMAEARDISHLLGRILIPTETEIRTAGGQRREVKRKLYPGYVLIEVAPTVAMRQLILQTSGVTHFVGSSDDPVPLPADEVEKVLATVGDEGQAPKTTWAVDQSVRVTDGPFSEFSGKIVEVNPDRETAKVLISIFGRETPVELDFTQIDRL